MDTELLGKLEAEEEEGLDEMEALPLLPKEDMEVLLPLEDMEALLSATRP